MVSETFFFSVGDVFYMNTALSKAVVVVHLSSLICHQKYSSSLPASSQVWLKSQFENVVVFLSVHKSFSGCF